MIFALFMRFFRLLIFLNFTSKTYISEKKWVIKWVIFVLKYHLSQPVLTAKERTEFYEKHHYLSKKTYLRHISKKRPKTA